ncbi:MAG: VOC family protein [Alphaproteobacteria bacterium]|jgi:hypothetical protein|nr:VOC family protein [Alphaproteobacteria bacterium]MDP6518199.1 VOC family protein [Alphaproteobacteria bacterium]
MRLRQIAFVARALAPAADELCAVLGLEVAYRDPGVGQFGLENVVVPIGGEFLEIVAPKDSGTAAERYLDRRGGDGGYMVILQCPDALAERARITGLGLRPVWRADGPDYRATHFHPRDAGGVLLSVDSVTPDEDYLAPMCPWEPAGPDWRRAVRTDRVDRMCAVALQSDDPEAMAGLWARILDRPAAGDGNDGWRIALDNATLGFVADDDGRGPGIGALDIHAVDPDRLVAAAEARGLKRAARQIEICGTRINLV